MKHEASEQTLRFTIRSVSGVHVPGSGNGDASQDDGEDENTNTSDEGLPLTGHLPSVSLRGIVWPTSAKKKSGLRGEREVHLSGRGGRSPKNRKPLQALWHACWREAEADWNVGCLFRAGWM